MIYENLLIFSSTKTLSAGVTKSHKLEIIEVSFTWDLRLLINYLLHDEFSPEDVVYSLFYFIDLRAAVYSLHTIQLAPEIGLSYFPITCFPTPKYPNCSYNYNRSNNWWQRWRTKRTWMLKWMPAPRHLQ